MAEAAANETLYINNLSEKIKIPALKKSLQAVFEGYGRILDLVAHGNLKMRGQAFVVFEDTASARKALEEVQGFPLFNKPMQIQYAKAKSDATIQRTKPQEYDEFKENRLAEKEKRKAETQKDPVKEKGPLKRQAAAQPAKRPLKKAGGKVQPQIPDEFLPPNKLLLVQGLPDDTTQDHVHMIFGRFPGLMEIRMVPGRKGIAFVEYEKEGGAIAAKDGTVGLTLGDRPVRVTYARK